MPYTEEDPDANDNIEDESIDHDEGKTKGGDSIESINGKDDESEEARESGDEDISDDGQTSAEPEPITQNSLPDLTIPPESLRPDDDFTGRFSNDEYAAFITKSDDGIMVVAIRTAGSGKTAYEWSMSGYFSDENYRIRYSDAVKTVIFYDKGGAEESRTIEYENGSGVFQFSDTEQFTWNNNMEPIAKAEFKKEAD